MTIREDAARLAAAFEGAGRVRALASPPRTVAEAYDLQDAVREKLGRPIVGWKLAQTVAKAQAAAGLDAPTVAPLLEGMIVPAETVFAAGFFYVPVVEAEIVLELGAPLSGKVRKEEVIAAVRAMRIGIEIADTRLLDKTVHGAPGVIADMNGAAALVIGPAMDLDEMSAALAAVPSVRLGDGSVADPLGTDMRPSPIDVLQFLSAFVAERGLSLPAGSLVTTGTHSVPTPSGPGQVTVRFGDTMRVGARLSAPRTR